MRWWRQNSWSAIRSNTATTSSPIAGRWRPCRTSGKPGSSGPTFGRPEDLEGLLAANRVTWNGPRTPSWEPSPPPVGTEEVVAQTTGALGVFFMDPPAYLLNAAAVKAHLSAHVREGRATFEIQDRRPIWRRLS